jgi:hypothetical protein
VNARVATASDFRKRVLHRTAPGTEVPLPTRVRAGTPLALQRAEEPIMPKSSPSTTPTPALTVTCACGFKARFPAVLRGRAVKCRRCGAQVRLGAEPERAPALEPKPRRGGQRSDLNIGTGALMVLLTLAAVGFGVWRASGDAQGSVAFEAGRFAGALAFAPLMLFFGAKTFLFGLVPIHGRDERLYAPAKVVLGLYAAVVGLPLALVPEAPFVAGGAVLLLLAAVLLYRGLREVRSSRAAQSETPA